MPGPGGLPLEGMLLPTLPPSMWPWMAGGSIHRDMRSGRRRAGSLPGGGWEGSSGLGN